MGWKPYFVPLPDASLLRKILRYEPETGLLFWLPRGDDAKWNNRNAGKEAFCRRQNGYRNKGTLSGREYLAHRIVWKIYHGADPAEQIDHVNRDRSDNRIANLREATNRENSKNKEPPHVGKSGERGVIVTTQGGWRAYLWTGTKQITLGTYDTKAEAKAARYAGERVWAHVTDAS